MEVLGSFNLPSLLEIYALDGHGLSARSQTNYGWGLGTHARRRIWIFFTPQLPSLSNGAKTPFWDSPWLLRQKPKDIAPLIFEASSRKNWKVPEALNGNAWILKLNNNIVVSSHFIRQFFTIWMLVHDLHLDEHSDDDIIWKHANDGVYSTASAYKA
ncbi:Serine carboxypeptidase-like 18 [Hordeum vulgare]|nr:Serine carboxypeptidase-like 18 [Hordeum vulgare]